MKRIITLLLLLVTLTLPNDYKKADAAEAVLIPTLGFVHEFKIEENKKICPAGKLELPEFYYETEDLIYGDFGSIVVGNYNAGLYGDLRRYDMSLDKYIDMEDAAPVYTLYSGLPYIPDHNFQGFDAILDEDTLTLHDTKGFPTEYIKHSVHYCYDLSDWITSDGVDVYVDTLGADLITQTCVPGGLAFVYWTKVN